MSHAGPVDLLEQSGRAILELCAGVEPEEARWRPAEDRWSTLEVLAHLADEETEDFGTRLRLTLESPEEDWPPIDPVGWVSRRSYREQDPREVLERFCRRSQATLDWLRGLQDPDWDRAKQDPRFNPLRAGDLLASWAAHDLIHLKQIALNRAAFLSRPEATYSTAYAMP